jgi:hypothetical protein
MAISGLQAGDRLQRSGGVFRLAAHPQVLLMIENGHKTLAHNGVIVHEKDLCFPFFSVIEVFYQGL